MGEVAVSGGFDGGHGSHWDAVIDDPGELGNIIRQAFLRGTVSGQAKDVQLRVGPAKARERRLALGDKGFEALLIELDIPGKGKPAVASLFPFVRRPKSLLTVTPTRVLEWGEGLEAEVWASLEEPGVGITFFAADYFANAERYRQGRPIDIYLTVVSYTLGVISPEPRIEEIAGKQIDVAKTVIIAPLKDSENAPYYDDDFFLQGRCVKVEPFGYPPWDEGAVLELELAELGAVPVFGRKKNFPHGWPKLGEMVASYSWMLGRAAE